MKLRKLAIGLSAVSALGLTSAAFAADVDAFDTAKSGLYVKVQGGAGFLNENARQLSNTLNFQDLATTYPIIKELVGGTPLEGKVLTLNPFFGGKSGASFIGRVALGYSLNDYFAVEAGYNPYQVYNLHFTGAQVVKTSELVDAKKVSDEEKAHNGKQSVTDEDDQFDNPQANDGLSALVKFSGGQNLTVRNSVDLIGKFTLPFDAFFAYVDGGAVYLNAQFDKKALKSQIVTVVDESKVGAAKITDLSPLDVGIVTDVSKAETKNLIRPIIGAGVGYNITNNVAIDVSYSRILGEASSKSDTAATNKLPNINQAFVGLTYKF